MLLTIAFGLALSCGGSGDGVSYETVSGQVELPGGLTAAEVLNARGAAVVAADGSFDLETTEGARQLAVAVSATGEPLLMGWFGPDASTLSTRSTAEVLVFFGANAFIAPYDHHAALQDALADVAELDDVVGSLEDALIANPEGLAQEDGALQDEISEASLALYEHAGLGSVGSNQQSLILVTPTSGSSGIDLNIVTGLDDVTIANRFRRQAFAFFDRVATFDENGNRTESPANVAELPIPSVQALKGAVDTVAQILAGTLEPGGLSQSQNVAYVPRSVRPVNLPNVEGVEKTLYRVAVVGPGARRGDLDQLTTAEIDKQVQITREFVIKELILPMILQFLVPASDLDRYLNAELAQSVVGDFIKIVTTQYFTIWEKAERGDMRGAFEEARDAILGSATFRDALLALTLEVFFDLSTEAGDAAYSRASTAAAKFVAITGAVDLVAAAFDASAVGGAIAMSNMADVWQVDAIDSVVRLEPGNSDVATTATRTLTTSVPAAGDAQVFEYRYSTTGQYGTLRRTSTNQEGNSITSSSAMIQYVADDVEEGGVDTVFVQVFAIEGMNRVSVGEAEATVNVTTGCDEDLDPVEARLVRTSNAMDNGGPSILRSAGAVYVWPSVEGADRYQMVFTGDRGSSFGLEAGKILLPFQPTGQLSRYYRPAREIEWQETPVTENELFYSVASFGNFIARDDESIAEWNMTVMEFYAQFEGWSLSLKPLCSE
ncbi:MAG: hypothetical protein WBG86_20925 [Polyangiales bacterium]